MGGGGQKTALINHPGGHMASMFPLCCGDGEQRENKTRGNMTCERGVQNQASEASVPALMHVPSDGLHQTEVNRNKWLELPLSQGGGSRVQLPPPRLPPHPQ